MNLITVVRNNWTQPRITFNDLCDFYDKYYLSEAKYVNNRKICGLCFHCNSWRIIILSIFALF